MSTPLRTCYQVQRPGEGGRPEVIDTRESLEEAEEALEFYRAANPDVPLRLVRYEVHSLGED